MPDRAHWDEVYATRPSDSLVERQQQGLRPGGRVIMATFAETGPERCSGLPVMRYGSESLHASIRIIAATLQSKRGGSGIGSRCGRSRSTPPSAANRRWIVSPRLLDATGYRWPD
ncbi:hypothetical protein [Ectothiorhodospira sp. BSL-9]|uniref:hypothetical protein n=1 Tax=Ectothiorhodospira sp. BSL-9 TaxID=1442136 RepID=UPI0007B42E8B|nr:hypothetical protein [Ectothiorhodospira sp. BSL-9]ANB02074.1 hypothetical protein ECTOBSL9_1358 [Ectothiorhodospira sp. BSL-9]